MLLMVAGPMIRGLTCVTSRTNARRTGDADADEGGSCMSMLEPDIDGRLIKRVKDRSARVALGAGLIAAATTFVAQIGTEESRAQHHGNHPIEASSLTSHAAADLPLKIHVSFALRNRPALNKLLSELQNPASPYYHKWLTPAEFDARFGRTTAEVQAVSQWLTSQGFYVTHSSARNLTASATVSRAEGAFATTIAASSDGATYGNLSDPQIPAQLTGVIGSIDGLHNTLHSQPLTVTPSKTPPTPAPIAPHGAAHAPLKPAKGAMPGSRGLGAG